MIDPRIWDSQQVMQLSPEAFKTFIYLISQADDAGKLPICWRMMASRVFPFGDTDADGVKDLVTQMDKIGLVTMYVVDGKDFIKHPNWSRFQKIDRPSESSIPDPPPLVEHSTKARRTLDERSRKTRRNGIEENRKEVNVIEGAPAVPAVCVKQDPRYLDLYGKLKSAFESKNAEMDYKREGPAMKWIVEHALTRDDPVAFITSMLNLFWSLTHDQREKIWYQQPFIPSVMRSGGLWPRLLTRLQDHFEDESDVALAKELTKDW